MIVAIIITIAITITTIINYKAMICTIVIAKSVMIILTVN